MAEATNGPVGPQPDFNRMGQIHADLAGEIRKLQNTPPSDNGQTILQRLDGLEEKLDNAVHLLNGRLHGLETKMDGLETKMGGLETKMGGLETKTDDLKKEQQNKYI
jgi:chromosome segregation ATPase